MNAKLEPANDTVDSVLALLQPTLSAAQNQQARVFVSHFFQRVAEDDIAARPAETWAALLRGLLDFVRVRAPGQPAVRVFNPTRDDNGWESTHTVVEIVTRDMPFLVDSVSIAAQASGLLLHGVIHPVYFVARDPGGHMLSLAADDAGKGRTAALAESVMHVEVDRLADAGGTRAPAAGDRGGAARCRRSVDDWPAMRDKMLRDRREPGRARSCRSTAEGVAEAQEFLRWAAQDHFTFLGYREYRVVKSGGDEVLQAVEDSGLGILRKSRTFGGAALAQIAGRARPAACRARPTQSS